MHDTQVRDVARVQEPDLAERSQGPRGIPQLHQRGAHERARAAVDIGAQPEHVALLRNVPPDGVDVAVPVQVRQAPEGRPGRVQLDRDCVEGAERLLRAERSGRIQTHQVRQREEA